jgi:hypothetical protein
VSEPTRVTTEAGLHGALRPFRLAAFELAAPLAGLEVALGAGAALTDVLRPPLGELDVRPLGSLAVAEPGRRAAAAPGSPVTRSRAGGSAASAGARTPPAAGAPTLGDSVAQVLEQIRRDAAVRQAAERVLPGAGTPAVALARGARAVADVPLLGELATAAVEAVAQPAPATGTRIAEALGGVPDAAGANGFSGIARALEEVSRDAAVSGAAEQVLPGTGRTAVAVGRGAQAAATLLEQLAETALGALAPAPPPAPVVPRARGRSGAEDAVRRELDSAAPTGGAAVPNGRHAPPRPGARRPDARTPVEDGRSAAQDPSELAWLVNEALVEQARRHGVDLS